MLLSESHYDCIIIGSGIAGLNAALLAAQQGRRVLVITKGRIDDCNSRYAQGASPPPWGRAIRRRSTGRIRWTPAPACAMRTP